MKPLGYSDHLLILIVRVCTYTDERPNKRPYSRNDRNYDRNSVLLDAKDRENRKHKYANGGESDEAEPFKECVEFIREFHTLPLTSGPCPR